MTGPSHIYLKLLIDGVTGRIVFDFLPLPRRLQEKIEKAILDFHKLPILYTPGFYIARKSDFRYTVFVATQRKIVKKKAKLTEQKADFAHHTGERRDVGTRKEYLEKRRDLLAVRLKAGNRAAAAELVDTYYERIYLYMRRLGHSCQVSEDLTQESFLQAWQHIGQLRTGKALNSWLYHIASNVSKLYWRRHKGRRAVSIEGFDVPDGSEADDDKIGDYEQFCRLKNAVGHLSMKLRQAVVLHYMQHLSIAEAADAAGVREGTFKSRLNRALKALRKHVI